jgi:hypothetical protein
MLEWALVYLHWWPLLTLAVVVGVAIWAARLRDANIRATSIICPTCGGWGRLPRDGVSGPRSHHP